MSRIEDFKPYPDYVGLNGGEVKYILNKLRSVELEPSDTFSVRVETTMIDEVYGSSSVMTLKNSNSDFYSFVFDLYCINHMKKYFDGKVDNYPSTHLLEISKKPSIGGTFIGKLFSKMMEELE